MTARATGRERAMGESREMTGRNREKVLKYRGEEGARVFEEKAEQFAVCPPFALQHHLPHLLRPVDEVLFDGFMADRNAEHATSRGKSPTRPQTPYTQPRCRLYRTSEVSCLPYGIRCMDPS